jgi:TFIIF-interacting CTD phosphatase-like protein
MSHLDKCIVLDLDETLIHTYVKKEIIDSSKGYNYLDQNVAMRGRLYRLDSGNGELSDLWSLKRPGTDMFIRYVMNNFGMVIVWSAGTKEYVERIVEWIFGSMGYYPDKVYSRDYCDVIPSGTLKGSYVKPITKLCNEPDLKGRISLSNILFVDDNTTSTSYNPANAITIPKFHPDPSMKTMLLEDDDALYKIIAWLESGKVSGTDVRIMDKSIMTIFSSKLKTGFLVDSSKLSSEAQNSINILTY